MRLIGKSFAELSVGYSASAERCLQPQDLLAWGAVFGTPGLTAPEANTQGVAAIVAAALSALACDALPGPGAAVRAVSVQVERPIPVGAPVTLRLSVREKRSEGGIVALDGACLDTAQTTLATATLEVAVPAEAVTREVPEHRLDTLLDRCRALKPRACGVVYPCSADALEGTVDAARAGLIVPVLFGPDAALKRIADAAALDLSGLRIVSCETEEVAAAQAAHAAGAGELQALMKGSLHTDVLLHAVMDKDAKLRTGRLLSHVALMSVPTYARRVVVTDAALNIAPDVDQKRDICQNAIGFALAMGIEMPKVAVLAAVEMVRSRMPATLDGAILSKMADRRQIVGGIVDGPLDLDAAVDLVAAKTKHIDSPVAGAADVLLVPNIESGNLVYKNLSFMADARSAGLVVGAKVPVILTSRADTAAARRFSAAAAALYADALAREPESIMPRLSE